jgi:hypothetical protein
MMEFLLQHQGDFDSFQEPTGKNDLFTRIIDLRQTTKGGYL